MYTNNQRAEELKRELIAFIYKYSSAEKYVNDTAVSVLNEFEQLVRKEEAIAASKMFSFTARSNANEVDSLRQVNGKLLVEKDEHQSRKQQMVAMQKDVLELRAKVARLTESLKKATSKTKRR